MLVFWIEQALLPVPISMDLGNLILHLSVYYHLVEHDGIISFDFGNDRHVLVRH